MKYAKTMNNENIENYLELLTVGILALFGLGIGLIRLSISLLRK